MPKAISFFAGAGGLDMGIHQSGFDVKLSVEIEDKFCETLKLNHPEWNVHQGDVLEFTKEDVYRLSGLSEEEDIDLFIGGSPCQSFSTAGKRDAFEAPGGAAMLKYADLVTEVQPKAFLLENVKGLLSAALKHRPLDKRSKEHAPLDLEEAPGSALAHLLTHFEGYNITYKLLNAADYGVPQTRERVFMIGIREDLETTFEFPEPTHSKDGENGKLPWVTFEDVMNQLMFTNFTYQNYSPDRLKYMKMIPKGGGNWRDLRKYGENVVKEAMQGAYESGGGKVGFFRRLRLDKPAPTLLTSPSQKSTNLGHPIEDRPLAIEEYKFIQGFPQDYKLTGSLLEQYKQIGNAVPVQLGKVMGKQILKTIELKVETRA